MRSRIPTVSGLVRAVQTAKPGSASISGRSALVGGALLFGGTAYFSYRYSNAHAVLPTPDPDAPIDPAAGFRVFDAIADKYDEAIGQEEAALWYGTMRKWLLKQATGDVLEISVGTGRNFKYYDLSESSGIRSLTCTDLSQHMLYRAEDKFFDELQLGMKHPNVKVNFVLADAHCLVDPNAKAPEPPKPKPKPKPEQPASGKTVIPGLPAVPPPPAPGAAGDGPHAQTANAEPYVAPWWAYWRHMPPRDDEPAPVAAITSSSSNASSSTGSSVAAAVGGEPPVNPDDMRELPGLHSRGLLNLFRVLLPEPSQPSSSGGRGSGASGSSSGSSESSDVPASSSAGSSAASTESAHAASKASGTGTEGSRVAGRTGQQGPSAATKAAPSAAAIKAETAGGCGCGSHAHPEGKEWQYVRRCTTGQLDGGAKLHRFAPGQFDTVVDTFGLCSHEDPVQVLKEMARVCKPGGRILLLQHGRSHYQWLNDKLDGSAADHQRKWGCLWNRDILDIVKQAGLVVDKSTRWHFGTSYYIVAYPPVQRSC
ncbi:hypothetical protein HYH02_001665 [Chlamydomonas schloesseri]|uniref:Methyltransferase type 11 domain-containing protein n=1 Tax=Chlamydomonas schloesseri TaxID=2026947 RepID=A0A836BC42_9CHLO|nr:hypothetical protein HYH02_001665 [Chlamydomonas schloesseri]|eukprot:KAG2453444.1 hypothetical protein HYH02_001665 [Chlamydomonas schloesseri]